MTGTSSGGGTGTGRPEPDPLAGYQDWPAAVRSAPPWQGTDGRSTALGAVLGLRARTGGRPEVVVTDERTRDGVEVQRLGWDVGHGPRTTAWLLRPAGERGPLPGVLGLHAHGGVRSTGAEQLVDLGPDASPAALRVRRGGYDGSAPATELARAGCVVLAHDTFSWGSRAFDLSVPTPRLAARLAGQELLWEREGHQADEDERFDVVSSWHEDTVAKAAGTLGTTFAGAVLADDLVALEVLAGLPGVDPDRLGAFGFSGGGGRTTLLAALDHRVAAAVVVCMMATFASLVPARLEHHSWLLHSPGLWSFADWPDLTAVGRARFLVQYGTEDHLFTPDGMAAAHARLQELHAGTGRYRGTDHPGGHRFDVPMQAETVDFLSRAAWL